MALRLIFLARWFGAAAIVATLGACLTEADGGEALPTYDAGERLPYCEGRDAVALGECVNPGWYRSDLEFIANPRPKGSAHLAAVRDLCASRLESLGFIVERHTYGSGTNVIGIKRGSQADGPRVLIGAHYDSTSGCPGADDNATGVAGLLEVSRVLSGVEHPGTLIAACWDEEELGLAGSGAYAARARSREERIDAHFNLEMIGYIDDTPGAQRLPAGLDTLFPAQVEKIEANESRADFITAIADAASASAVALLEHHAQRLGLPFIGMIVPAEFLSSPAIGDLRRSDHAPFWDKQYPGIMITDSSEFRYPSYHCRDGKDEVSKLDHDFSVRVIQMIASAAAEALVP